MILCECFANSPYLAACILVFIVLVLGVRADVGVREGLGARRMLGWGRKRVGRRVARSIVRASA
jgi:hypothetical protein